MNITESQLRNIIIEELLQVLDEKRKKRKKRKKKKKKGGKKDACYHKVKSRYSVWPSAYASGALSKCRKVGAKNWGNKSKKNESIVKEDFEPHMMYDPKSDKSEMTKKKEDHERLSKKGYTHIDPNKLRKVLEKEGGASGLGPFLDAFDKDMEDEIIKTLEMMSDVGQHKDKDYILDDGKEIEVVKEEKKNCGCGQDPCKTYGTKKKIEEKKKRKRKRKLTKKPSSESNLRDWFKRKGAKGSKGGWVDCNAPDGKGGYKSCGRSSGEKRKKYPACRPTPSACKSRGKGKKWGKKGGKKK